MPQRNLTATSSVSYCKDLEDHRLKIYTEKKEKERKKDNKSNNKWLYILYSVN